MTIANVGVVLAAAVATAFGGLLADEVLPKPAAGATVAPVRVVASLIAVIILITLLYLRGKVHALTGTFVYVSILDEEWEDLRSSAARAASDNYMAFRSISRWVDLPHRAGAHNVIEAVDVAQEVGGALEQHINSGDDPHYTVAPNMPWPLALSVGAYLPGLPRMRLAQTYGDRSPDVFALESSQASEEFQHDVHPGTGSTANRVGVWLAFTPAAVCYSINDFDQYGITEVHVLCPRGGLPTTTRAAAMLDSQQLGSLPLFLARTLIQIKQQADDRELVVVAMIPSAVAFATGWHIAQQRHRFFAGTHLMHYSPDKGMIAMRVRDSQPAQPPNAP